MADIRNISAKVACAVAKKAYASGLATNLPKPHNLLAIMESEAYQPSYRKYR